MSQTITFPQGPVVDPQTGYVSLEWFEWFQNPQILSLVIGTALDPASGGTGIISYTIGDIIYASAATTLAKLHDVATGNALISGGVGVAPSWGKVGLTTHVSGTLPVANGGTGVTSSTGTIKTVLSDSPAFTTQISTPSIVTASGALGITPAAGSGLNINLSTTGDLAVNTNQLYVDTSAGMVGINTVPTTALHVVDGAGSMKFRNSNQDNLHITGTNTVIFADSTNGNLPGFFLGIGGSILGIISTNAAAPTASGIRITNASGVGASIDASGRLLTCDVNPQIASLTIGNAGKFQVAGSDAAGSQIQVSRHSADAGGAHLAFGKSRNATTGGNTIVQSGDVVGTVTGYGANGSTFTNAAQISMEIDGTPGATNDMPGRIVFLTTPDGSGTLTEALRLNQNQTATFASTVSATNLTAWSAFTPARTGWNDVGTPTVTGRKCQVGNICYFQVKIVPATTVASVAGTSYIALPIAAGASGIGGAAKMDDITTMINVGSGVIDVANSRVYVPTQNATADGLAISWYY